MNCYRPYYRRKFGFRFGTFILCAALVVATIFAVLEFYINPIIVTVARVQYEQKLTGIVNESVISVVKSSPEIGNLLKIQRDKDNNIVSVEVDSAMTNTLHRDIIAEVKKGIAYEGATGCKIPIGTLSGLMVFSGKGKDVTIQLLPYGNALAEFSSEFSSAGINQTRFCVYTTVAAKMTLVLANKKEILTSQAQVLLIDTLIVGKVPDYIIPKL